MQDAVLRRLAAGVIIGAALAVPRAAFCEPQTAEIYEYRVPATIALPRLSTPARPASPTAATRIAMYVLQGIDAVQTGAAVRAGGREQNPMLRPLSHSALGMAAGFALGDVIRGALVRRAPDRVKTAVDGAQAASNLEGILFTRASLDAHGR